jgi:hypothetical protein
LFVLGIVPEDLSYCPPVLEELGGFTPEEIAELTNEEVLRTCVELELDFYLPPESLYLMVDGIPVENMDWYRTQPAFSLYLGEEHWWNEEPVEAGLRELAVLDGYGFLLAPLTPGEHLIQTGMTDVFEHQIHVTVVPPGKQ